MSRVRQHLEDLPGADVVRVQAAPRRAPVARRGDAPSAGGLEVNPTAGITKRINAIKFALLSPDESRRMSATKIITADTYDDDGSPIDMGLMDSHLGVIEPGLRGKTCGGKAEDRPRPFGHIAPAMPDLHVGYVKR